MIIACRGNSAPKIALTNAIAPPQKNSTDNGVGSSTRMSRPRSPIQNPANRPMNAADNLSRVRIGRCHHDEKRLGTVCFSRKSEIAKDRIGSAAAAHHHFSSTTASGGIPVVRVAVFQNANLNVCFSRERTFKPLDNRLFEGLLTATSGRSLHCW